MAYGRLFPFFWSGFQPQLVQDCGIFCRDGHQSMAAQAVLCDDFARIADALHIVTPETAAIVVVPGLARLPVPADLLIRVDVLISDLGQNAWRLRK